MKLKTNHNDLVNNNYTNLPFPTLLLEGKEKKIPEQNIQQCDSKYTFKSLGLYKLKQRD